MVLVASAIGLLAACSGPRTPPSVVLVIVDTLRADHLSAYGYARDTTPALARLAEEGVRYDNAFAQSSWTLPTIATVLTGMPPHLHGAGRTATGVSPIRATVPTLAERMQAAGWRTGAIVNVVWLHPQSGAARGFDDYDFETTDGSNRRMRDAARSTDAAIGWLERAREDPFFLVVHYFDPHLTYDPPAPYDTMFPPDNPAPLPPTFGSAQEVFTIRSGERPVSPAERETLIARYDGEIRYVDDQFARLRRKLESIGRWDDTLVIVVADHGEEFWDHGGFEHGHTHYDEMVRVPLIVRDPRQTIVGAVADRVRQLDVAPTVLDFAGLAVDELPGRPLGSGSARFAVAEGSLWGGDLVSVRSDDGSVILNRDSGEATAYAASDPTQQQPGPVGSTTQQSLLEMLHAVPKAEATDDPGWQPDPEQLERLRSLGYVR